MGDDGEVLAGSPRRPSPHSSQSLRDCASSRQASLDSPLTPPPPLDQCSTARSPASQVACELLIVLCLTLHRLRRMASTTDPDGTVVVPFSFLLGRSTSTREVRSESAPHIQWPHRSSYTFLMICLFLPVQRTRSVAEGSVAMPA